MTPVCARRRRSPAAGLAVSLWVLAGSGAIAADTPMSSTAIRDLLTSNTMYCRNLRKDESFINYFRDDGTVTKLGADGTRTDGTWRVSEDGRHCLDWGEHERCTVVLDAGDGRYRKTEDAEPHSEFSVVPGNPEGL